MNQTHFMKKRSLTSLAGMLGKKLVRLQPDTFGPNSIKRILGKTKYVSITYRLPAAENSKGKDWEPFLTELANQYDGIRERWLLNEPPPELTYEECLKNVLKKTRRMPLENLSSKKLEKLCPYEYGRLRRVHLKKKGLGANWKKLWRDMANARAK